MGCGQSKIGNIYPKNKKNKNNSGKKSSESVGEWLLFSNPAENRNGVSRVFESMKLETNRLHLRGDSQSIQRNRQVLYMILSSVQCPIKISNLPQ